MPYKYGGCEKDELNSYEIFPEGTYDFYIEAVSETYNLDGDEIVKLTLKPSRIDQQKLGKIWHIINLNNEWARLNVGRLLTALGRDPEEAQEVFFQRFEGEHLKAKIVHTTAKNGKKYANARLLAMTTGDSTYRQGEKPEPSYSHQGSLADEWDGESGRDDDIPF